MNQISALVAPRIFDGEIWHDKCAVVVEGQQVRGIVPVDEVPGDAKTERFEDGFLAPGFVDLQVNGGGGVLLNNDPSVAGIRTICSAHARFGTGALLPTLITDTPEVSAQGIAAGVAAAKAKVSGFAGLHLEGPHLSVARKGAHDPALIRPMGDEDVTMLIEARKQLPVLMVTVAPESVTPDQVKALVEAGIKVSIGHSDAVFDQVMALVDAGGSMITHLFNAMSQLTGRAPGMVGAALGSGALYVGLIADGHHVHPATMATALRAKAGPGKIFLVSDAMSTIGTDVTEFVLNGRKIKRAGGKLTLEDGTLAGADIDLATAVRVIHQKVGVELGEALRMATLYPADAASLSDVGRLTPGYRANLVLLNDEILPVKTWIDGQAV